MVVLPLITSIIAPTASRAASNAVPPVQVCNPASCPAGQTASFFCPDGPSSGFGTDCTLLAFCSAGNCCYGCGQIGGTPPQCA